MKTKKKKIFKYFALFASVFMMTCSINGAKDLLHDSHIVAHAAETTKTISSFTSVGSYTTNWGTKTYNGVDFFNYRVGSGAKLVMNPSPTKSADFANGALDGCFFNVEPIAGLKSVKVTFSGSSSGSIEFGENLHYTSKTSNIKSGQVYEAPSGSQAFRINCGSSKMTVTQIQYTYDTSATETAFEYYRPFSDGDRGDPQIATGTSITVPWTNGDTKTLTKGNNYTDISEIAAYYVAFGTWPNNYGISGKTYKVSEYNLTDGYTTSVPWSKSGYYYELDVDLDGTYTTSSRGVGRLVCFDKGFSDTANGYGSEPVVVYSDDHYKTFQEYDNKGGWMKRFNGEGTCTAYSRKSSTLPPEETPVVPAIKVANEQITIQKGESFNMNATVENITGGKILYYSEESTIASVDSNGNVTGESKGTTRIAAYYSSNTSLIAYTSVTVEAVEPPTSITINGSVTTIAVDAKTTLSVSVVPSDAANTVTWSSSNNNIATVNNGVVTGVSAGDVVITATSTVDTSVKGEYSLYVKGIASIALSGTPTQVKYASGDKFNPDGLTVTATYTDGSTEVIDNNDCDWLDANSLDTLLDAGTTKVICKYGNVETYYEGITVTQESGKVTITRDSFTNATSSYAFQEWTSGNISGEAFIYGGTKDKMQFSASKASYYIFNTTKIPGAIQSVSATTAQGSGSWELLTNSTAYYEVPNAPEVGTSHGAKTLSTTETTWTLTTTNRYFALKYNGRGAAYLSSIVVKYGEVDETKALKSLELSGTLENKLYVAGEIFNPLGLTVTATFEDNTTLDVTNEITWSANELDAGTTSVTGTYDTMSVTVTGITVLESLDANTVIAAIEAAKNEFSVARDNITDLSNINAKMQYVDLLLTRYLDTDKVTNYGYVAAMKIAYEFVNDTWYAKIRVKKQGTTSQGSRADSSLEICEFLNQDNTTVENLISTYEGFDNKVQEILNNTFDTAGNDGSVVTIGQSVRYIAQAHAFKVDSAKNNSQNGEVLTSNNANPVLKAVLIACIALVVLMSAFISISVIKSKKKKVVESQDNID